MNNESLTSGSVIDDSVTNNLVIDKAAMNTPAVNTSDRMSVQNGMPQSKRMGQRLRKMIDDFRYFGIGCFLYGIFFTICLYKGFHGIRI